ncbi:hypothetical protein B0H13DRAFT_1914964 [Mycena leptocephala]|nr:hypothetical protein B0H13DRAFT_1914964 [Mycena leptocephala]
MCIDRDIDKAVWLHMVTPHRRGDWQTLYEVGIVGNQAFDGCWRRQDASGRRFGFNCLRAATEQSSRLSTTLCPPLLTDSAYLPPRASNSLLATLPTHAYLSPCGVALPAAAIRHMPQSSPLASVKPPSQCTARYPSAPQFHPAQFSTRPAPSLVARAPRPPTLSIHPCDDFAFATPAHLRPLPALTPCDIATSHTDSAPGVHLPAVCVIQPLLELREPRGELADVSSL